MKATSRMPDVFISYPRDRVLATALARQVRERLADRGIKVFESDKNTSPEAVRDAIAEADAVVVLISDMTSSWLAFESGAAMAWGKPTFAVKSSADDSMPSWLKNTTAFTVKELDKLAERILKLQRGLSSDDRDLLLTLYAEGRVPVDQLFRRPAALHKLADRYSSATNQDIPPQAILEQLLLLRKRGELPRLGRQTG